MALGTLFTSFFAVIDDDRYLTWEPRGAIYEWRTAFTLAALHTTEDEAARLAVEHGGTVKRARVIVEDLDARPGKRSATWSERS